MEGGLGIRGAIALGGVAAYTVGRFWTEYLRIDESHTFLGLRVNNWTSVVVFLGAIACLVVSARRHPGIEDVSRPKGEGGDEPAGEPHVKVAVKTGGIDAR
ncbi:prolipoprotein diacylglyceryl transferase family protein [Streptomyces sp. NPDC002467]|uniref:prolipoprotein diacylglyceryl transferase family protein n=1 Tax=Streptomyces sp. NPDC002467 TaxID=3364647 RepID=UPI00368FECD5